MSNALNLYPSISGIQFFVLQIHPVMAMLKISHDDDERMVSCHDADADDDDGDDYNDDDDDDGNDADDDDTDDDDNDDDDDDDGAANDNDDDADEKKDDTCHKRASEGILQTTSWIATQVCEMLMLINLD